MNKDFENENEWKNWNNTADVPLKDSAPEYINTPEEPSRKAYPMPDPYASEVTGDQIHPMEEYAPYYPSSDPFDESQPAAPVNPFEQFSQPEQPVQQSADEVYPQPERPVQQNADEIYPQPERPVQQSADEVYPQPERPVQQNADEVYPQPERPVQQSADEVYPQPERPVQQSADEVYPQPERPVQQDQYDAYSRQNPYGEYAQTGDSLPYEENIYEEYGQPVQYPFVDYAQREGDEPVVAYPNPAPPFTEEEVTIPFDEPKRPAPQPRKNPDSAQQYGSMFNQSDENSNPAQPPVQSNPEQPNASGFNQPYENGNPVQPNPAQPNGDFRQPYGGEIQHLSKKEIKARRKALKKQKKAEKGNKGKIIGFSVLAVVVAIAIAGYFVLFHDPNADVVKGNVSTATTEAPSATVTDASGNTYAAVVDENGVTYAAVRDSDGHLWQVNINPDGSFGDAVASLDGVLDTTTAAASTINETVNTAAYTGAARDVSSTTASSDTGTTTAAAGDDSAGTTAADSSAKTTSDDTTKAKESKSTTASDGSSSEETEFNFLRYQKMFASGTYYMEFTTNDEDLGDGTIVSAGKNGNVYFNTTLEGITASILYLASEDKSYIIIDEMSSYCSLPKKLLGEDVDMKDMNIASGMFSENITSDVLSSKEVELNGQTLTCEYCETTSGAKYEYYFDDGTLVRVDVTSTDGSVNEMYFSKITTEVDDSVFTIPDGYKYLNLSWLG